jgi:hypothetical protein
VGEFGVTAFHQNCGGTNHVINVTEQKALSPDVFTVTACHALRGSGSSEINVTERGIILPMDCNDTVMHQRVSAITQNHISKQGFQHLYKSTKTMSSLRVLAAHKGTIKHGAPRNFFLKKTWSKKARQNNQLTSC